MKNGLSTKEFFVDPNIDRAESLPASAFADPEFLELELGTIFARTWLLAPQENNTEDDSANLASSLEKKGSRVPFNLLGKPFFLQRGQKGRRKWFPNVGTHACSPRVECSGLGGTIGVRPHGS